MAIERKVLETHLNSLLKPQLYRDYGPNGLQIEGKSLLKKIAFAVSATRESVNQACVAEADALIVHHGLFWDFHGVRTITGPFAQRVAPLIRKEINLFGYHLPLDGQQEMGNAASLATLIGTNNLKPFGDYKGMPTGVWGSLTQPRAAEELRRDLEIRLDHPVMMSASDKTAKLTTIGIITGGANSGWKDAAALKLDGFLTGEMSEHDWNEAKEAGVVMFAGGHHATEAFGIQSLMKNVQAAFPRLECVYFKSDNPA